MTTHRSGAGAFDAIARLLQEPTPKAVEQFLKSRHVFWVDWRTEDSEIVFDCERCLRTGALTAESREPNGLYIRHGDRGAEVPLSHSGADRHITIHTLNSVLAPDYEIRFCVDSKGAETLAFLALRQGDWRDLEAKHEVAVSRRFYRIAAQPNLFTDDVDLPDPPVVLPPQAPKNLREAWRALAEEADALSHVEPETGIPCENATAYVLAQLRLGGIDLERLQLAVGGAPRDDRDLLRMVVACCDQNPVALATTADPAVLLNALAFLAPGAEAKTCVTREVVHAVVKTIIAERKLGEARELDALDRLLGETLTRDAFMSLDPDYRRTLTALINRLYERMAEHDPERWALGRWAPHSIEFVGDSESLALLRRFTSCVMELDPCASNRAKASLSEKLYNERLQRLCTAHADAGVAPAPTRRPTHARHSKFGVGEIVRFLEGDKVAVRFGAETKTLLGSALEFIFPEGR
jgi:hypothetical protein